MPKRRPRDRVTGADVIKFIHQIIFVPEGRFVGRPMRLDPWQQDEIRRIYDNPHGTRRAILSMGRKNAKSTLAACLLLNHLCGPSARLRPNSQCFSAAQSRDQAGLIFALALKMIRMNPDLAAAIRVREAAKELLCPELGTSYRALSAEASTAFGLSPTLIIHDELGQVRGPRSSLYEALETATAAQVQALSIIISTQAPGDNDLFSILIDDAKAGHDPRTTLSLYTAPCELDPFAEDTIRLANPAYDTFLNKTEVLGMAADARRMPSREAEYRNLLLNQRVEASSPFVTPTQWQACSGAPFDLTGRDVFAGLDLSETRDLTALVLVGTDIWDGSWHVRPTFWLPNEGLYDKARSDRIPYDLWYEQGYLETTPGPSVSYEYVAYHLRQVFDQHHVIKLGFDRWNLVHLKPWLLNAGFSEQVIKDKFVGFGQGFKDMSPALRDLESIILEKKLRHGGHPVLTMCSNNAVIERDPAGNRKLSKKRAAGRIDGMIALLIAIGVAPQQAAKVDIEALIG